MRKGRQGCRGIKTRTNRYSRFSRNRDRVQLQPTIKTVLTTVESLLSRRFYAAAIYIYIYKEGGFSNGTARVPALKMGSNGRNDVDTKGKDR